MEPCRFVASRRRFLFLGAAAGLTLAVAPLLAVSEAPILLPLDPFPGMRHYRLSDAQLALLRSEGPRTVYAGLRAGKTSYYAHLQRLERLGVTSPGRAT